MSQPHVHNMSVLVMPLTSGVLGLTDFESIPEGFLYALKYENLNFSFLF
jgi:hypothetical protein